MIKNEKGFTLIEMLIVLLIISILLIITIPNVIKHNEVIDEKGCEAYKDFVQSQVLVYKMDNNKYPEELEDLRAEGYIRGEDVCELQYNNNDGSVRINTDSES